ncbi:MAG: nicotinate (nicotinamide) nucleotide adenylyltransferase [Bacteroides sp.]|nr:nicotinate (nicotinamide) nucleotide adenylyltransferase [Ruminococcus flavefaciens]MCM1553980.1 nicotinate (nicotinamide) nucleotide adenylyltransferase [Bacteroides sp.]
MPTVILYFGSFNPVHNGHIALAEAVSRIYKAEVWFVLSPQNPFKQDLNLWSEQVRARLLKEALHPHPSLRFCDAELQLPKPSYTINTLNHLQHEYPGTDFLILMGEDNLAGLHRWKAVDEIMNLCRILVYPRKDTKGNAPKPDAYPILERFGEKINVLENLPLLDISSTQIRKMMAEKEDVSGLVPWKVPDPENLIP